MSFFIAHRYGGHDADPPLEVLPGLLDELDEDPDDIEHTDVSVTHESDWCVAAYRGNVVTLENLEDLDIEPRHMHLQSRAQVLSLFESMALGKLDEVFAQPWKPGYG
jgi:hypothetical protein